MKKLVGIGLLSLSINSLFSMHRSLQKLVANHEFEQMKCIVAAWKDNRFNYASTEEKFAIQDAFLTLWNNYNYLEKNPTNYVQEHCQKGGWNIIKLHNLAWVEWGIIDNSEQLYDYVKDMVEKIAFYENHNQLHLAHAMVKFICEKIDQKDLFTALLRKKFPNILINKKG